jgi:hypothetical protein
MGSTLNTPLIDIPDDLVRPEVIAELLQISPRTLENQRSRGGGPPYVVVNRRTIRYSRRAVAEWLEVLNAPRPRTHRD